MTEAEKKQRNNNILIGVAFGLLTAWFISALNKKSILAKG